MPVQSNDYALVIGLNDYPRYGSKGRNLNGAVSDAERFAEWLTDARYGGGLPEANCKFIRSRAEPIYPGKDDIDDALEIIWKAAKKDGGRRFYLFFSGHGQTIEALGSDDIDIALCLPRWSRTSIHAALSAQSYHAFARKCTPFDEIVMFLDCCRVPAVKARAERTRLGCINPVDHIDETRRLIIYAAEHQKAAFEGSGARGVEANEDGADDSELIEEVRGHFTTALLAALKGEAARDAGGVTAEALKSYLRTEVPRIAKLAGHIQNPAFGGEGLREGAIFGTAKPGGAGTASGAAHNFEIRFSDRNSGQVQLIDGDLNVVRAGNPAEGPWSVALSFGLYVLFDVQTEEDLPLRFRPGMEGGYVTF